MHSTTGLYNLLVVLGVLCVSLSSCAQQAAPPPVAPAAEGTPVHEYVLGAEDVVEVLVWKNPDLSKTVTVRPDGKISLPLIGDVQAAGLTAAQLSEQIGEQLTPYYKEPALVSVIVQEVNSYAVYILGEVRNPGKYVVKSGTTFIQAITLAGGFTEFASTNKITLLRRNDTNTKDIPMGIRYRDVVAGHQNNLILKPNDNIIVP
jgi:polysaccharide export outer membrane protein